MNGSLQLFTGNAHLELGQKVAKILGVPLGQASVSTFRDGETSVELGENVRGKDVFLIQPTCAPPNRNLMELLLMADALHRASAGRVTAVIPYFGYARQDRRVYSARVPISAKVVTDMIEGVHINRVLTVDLHAEPIQGFFRIPVDNIFGSPVLIDYLRSLDLGEQPVLVSPDIGGVVRARAFAKMLNADLAIIDKRRPRANEIEAMHVIGEVGDRVCIIADDIVDTGGTLCQAAIALKRSGAQRVIACCTHPVLSGDAVARIEASELDELVVTDTIPLQEEAQRCKRIHLLDIASLLAESIRRISNEESLSILFR